MAYIIKNTSGLVNTRVTDTGRQKLSQGNFNISYFQVGDSEVSYDKLPNSYNQTNSFVLEPAFNQQNSFGVPQSNKQSVKYPYFVDGVTGNTYGIPFNDSTADPVFNRAPLRGFFTGNTTASTITWSAITTNNYVVSSNYVVDLLTLDGSKDIELIYSGCNHTNTNRPSVGDIITIYYDGYAKYNCGCVNLPTPTPTSSPNSTPTLTPTPSSSALVPPCLTPSPTPTPTSTPCITPSSSAVCPAPPPIDCNMSMYSCFPILTYRIVAVCGNVVTLDRPTPDFSCYLFDCFARVIIYPSSMTQLYDSFTPRPHWCDDVINFETVCDIDEFDVKIWNMNIPWTESPAGLLSTFYKDYTQFGSINYIGSKEYFGYNSSSGQTDTSSVYYYNSFDQKITVTPEEQKAVAIIHYTNQTVDFFYGEKFALEPYDPTNPNNTSGQARNFKLHIPWIMWHKNPECCFGDTFYVDPAGFDDLNLFTVHYLKSTKNEDMNNPGIRYYHLWDTHPNDDGYPSRIGKVFPDSKVVIIDDEEILAAMSYKSNRNWTLAAPQVSLTTPNVCDTQTSPIGLLTGSNQTLYVTYRLSNDVCFTNSLHCNYYQQISYNDCITGDSKNVAVRFGGEFGCLVQPYDFPVTTTTTSFPFQETCFILTEDTLELLTENLDNLIWCDDPNLLLSPNINDFYQTASYYGSMKNMTSTTYCPSCDVFRGFVATKFQVLVQLVNTGERPDPAQWRIIDFTTQIEDQFINGYVTEESLTGSTFIVSPDNYNSAPYYNLNDYVPLTPISLTGSQLNFGDEYYFYGSLETDIQATIYEMKYKINLSVNEFKNTTNPSWSAGTKSYITEIALLDSDKDVLVISKLQSPVQRQGIQQFVVKLDF
jgi:hypothetical protein